MKNVVTQEKGFLQENLIDANLLYEGKGKKLYNTTLENTLLAAFKDDLTAFNARKKVVKRVRGA